MADSLVFPSCNIIKDILIVDDDKSMRFLLRETLASTSCVIHEAKSGKDALQLLEHVQPDLVVADVCMPDMDGFELCEHIRANPLLADMPILTITGLHDLTSIQKAFDSGATDFITKPINWGLLPHRVHFLMRNHQIIREAKLCADRLIRAQKAALLGWFDWDITNQSIEMSAEIYDIFEEPYHHKHNFFETLMKSVHPDDACRFSVELEALNREKKSPHIEYRIQTRGGKIKTIQLSGEVMGGDQALMQMVSGTIQDVSERAEAEKTIRRLAYYDQVTGLPNRGLYKEHLRSSLSYAKREGHKVAVMFLDLDKFKRINDTLGHRAGDALLAKVAEILSVCIRGSDVLSREDSNPHEVARMGGDEFTLLLTHVTNSNEISLVARRIVQALKEPMTLEFDGEKHEVVISSSIGIAVYPDDGSDANDLLKKADVAMYRVKNHGRNAYCFFDSSMQAQENHEMSFEAELRHAIAENELVLFYQAKVAASTGKIVGLEALVRWQHPQQGILSPYKFIPMAEDLGLAVALGSWVLREACTQHQAWKKTGVPTVPIAVNLSGQQFFNRCLFSEVNQVLVETGMDPYALELEITETVLMKNADRTMNTLNQLKDIGISLAVDDFGTGYSSMSYLKHFPLDVLKIDGSFVRGIPQSKQDCGIVEAVVSLAKSLDLKTIAEYVETPEQLHWLQDIGCDHIQGYLFSQPLPAVEVEAKLRQQQFVLPGHAGVLEAL